MTEFHETPLGRRHYEHTLPELLRQVTRLADAVERLTDSQVRAGTPDPRDRGGPRPPQGDHDDPED